MSGGNFPKDHLRNHNKKSTQHIWQQSSYRKDFFQMLFPGLPPAKSPEEVKQQQKHIDIPQNHKKSRNDPQCKIMENIICTFFHPQHNPDHHRSYRKGFDMGKTGILCGVERERCAKGHKNTAPQCLFFRKQFL